MSEIPRGTPFRAARTMGALIAAALAGPKHLLGAMLAGIPAYQGRGHSGHHRQHGSRMKVLAKMRRQSTKYNGHQGKQEIARRLRQLAR